MLEYADTKNPDVWSLMAPPSDSPVIDDIFTTWVPPYQGTFYVKLTVWDKAGNTAVSRRRVSWGLPPPSITNFYKSYEFFSPNGDGVKDTVELHYKVFTGEPTHFEFYVYDENDNLVKTYIKGYTSTMEDYVSWDGTDEHGMIVPDGTYKIGILDYTFFVKVDNTLPDANLVLPRLLKGYVEFEAQTLCYPIHSLDHSLSVLLTVLLKGYAFDKNLKQWTIEYGEGDNPQEWVELKKGEDSIVICDDYAKPVLDPMEDITIEVFEDDDIEFLVGKN